MTDRGMFPLTIERPETASQTLLGRIDVCPFSGGLYVKHKGGPRSHALIRGELVHLVLETATNMLIEQGEPSMPPEVAKDLAQAIMEERPDLSVPAAEQEVVRICAWHWAQATQLELDRIAAVEATMTLELGGWTIRGRIDRAEIVDTELYVRDYKTSLAILSQEDYENDFQSQTYALLAAEGDIGGMGRLSTGLTGFHRIQEYPRYLTDDGNLVSRYAYSDPGNLYDFKQTLQSHLATLEHGLEAGEWLATPGSHCQTCPAIGECPIPEAVRGVRTIATPGEAMEVAERIHFLSKESRRLRAAARAWSDENGAIPIGDLELGFKLTESDRATDKPALFEFLREHGRDPMEFFTHQVSSKYDIRKVSNGNDD